MVISGCRNRFLRPLIFIFCLSLVDQTGFGHFREESLCSSEANLSHELFLCNGQQAKKEQPALTKEEVLSDVSMRISPEFKIDDSIRNRVSFWFDVYTYYDSQKSVMHHTDFPWIIFKVLDHTEVMSRPKARWVNQTKANATTQAELYKLKNQIAGLIKKSKFKRFNRSQLNDDEKNIVNQLLTLPGNLTSNLIRAHKNIRVQTGQKDFFIKGIQESQDYMKTMENVFLQYRLPIELARLPMVESSFNSKATSKAGAAGIWQFMPSTGKKFMMITDQIDERRSPFKSTEAAAELLKENYLLFQNWALALTAYNHGPGGLRVAIRKVKSREISDIISKYESKIFAFAGQNYYCEFLAALYAEKYALEVYGNIFKSEKLEFEKVELLGGLRPNLIMSWLDLSKDDFVKMNPDIKLAIKQNKILPRGFGLYLTPNLAFDFRGQQKKYFEDMKKSLKIRRVADM